MVALAADCHPDTESPPSASDDLFAPTEIVGQVRKQPLLEKVEAILLCMPQAPHEMKHSFAPGIYVRQIKMFKGTTLIGQPHKTAHFNFIMTGRATVVMEGKTQEIVAPCYFKSDVGVQKVLHIHEDMIWATIHANPTDETDLDKLFDMIAAPSETFKSFHEMLDANGLSANRQHYLPRKEEVDSTSVIPKPLTIAN
jgi:hypothetical protein